MNAAQSPFTSDGIVHRIRGEYMEMPGLTVTHQQAQRLWGLSSTECERLLEQLVLEGFLHRTQGGAFVKD